MGGWKRQKRGFLPILGTIAKPLLASAAGAIDGEVLRVIGKTYFGENNAVEKKERKDIDMLKNYVLLQRLPNPSRVQLPNGRVNGHAESIV